MKKLNVRFLVAADTDLDSILHWIASATGDAAVADKFVDRILDRCSQLSDFPEMGVARNDISPGLRLLAFEKRAAIFYRIRGGEVVVSRVLYRGRDYDETTFED